MTRRTDMSLALFGVALALAGILIGLPPPLPKPPDPPDPPPAIAIDSPDLIRQRLRERVESHLTTAEQQGASALDTQLGVLETFFAEARKRTPEFTEVVLGFDSKWHCLADLLPGSSGGSHVRYIEAQFHEHLFAPEALEQVIQQVVTAYLAELENIDHLLLVEITADLKDLPRVLPVQTWDHAQLEAACVQLRTSISQQVESDLRADASQTLVSLIVGEVLTAVTARMGVSAGVLGTGAATSWTTLGTGFLVGLIVDEIVAWIWDWWADPRGQLVQELNQRLTDLEARIIEGSFEQPGLRWHLQDIARRRTLLRKRTVMELLDSGDSP